MEPTTIPSSPSSSSSTIHQEEPMDSTTGNPTPELTTADLQQQQTVQSMGPYDEFVKQNMSFFQQTLMRIQTSNPSTAPNESSENDLKKNGGTPKKVLTIEENESTPSPTKRQISTGKVDEIMVEKAKRRRAKKNARKQIRMRNLSIAYEELRDCLPSEEGIEAAQLSILKIAIEYIQFLHAVLAGDPEEEVKCQEKLLHEMKSAKPTRMKRNV
ncbi:hypothetical protein CAEBREN_18060 [Caenorhabditis brenneri]|uniref:BHLH domain-containing protein n=1 Tax=Caenorhabditis brenneri TaxID=135651 RepID=G0NI01_CAEBE|nr:hypothetical protein CAEBREN_18060 [Caenorhabditis brenneri]